MEQESEEKKLKRIPLELRWFLILSSLLWLVSISFIVVRAHHSPNSSDRLLPVVFDRPFSDLLGFRDMMSMVHQPDFFTKPYGWIYPAPCVLFYKVIVPSNKWGHIHSLYAGIPYCLVALAGLFLLVRKMVTALEARGLSRRNSWRLLLATTLLSWPIFFALRQGNMEGIIWIGVAVAVWAYYRGMWWTSAILIGLFAGFKIYPILLLGLFLPFRKYSLVVVSLLVFTAFTIVGLAYIGPTIPFAYRFTATGIKSFTELGFYPGAVDRGYLTYDHSLVSLIRIGTTSHPEYMLLMARYYMPVAALLMTVYFLVFIWKMPRLNQLLVIVLAIVLLPPKSYDYTLQMLYIPWSWLALMAVSAAKRGQKIAGLMPVMICLALICSPEVFIEFGGFHSFGQFKTLCLLALLWMSTKYRFSDDQWSPHEPSDKALKARGDGRGLRLPEGIAS